jgi:hypothetical protein
MITVNQSTPQIEVVVSGTKTLEVKTPGLQGPPATSMPFAGITNPPRFVSILPPGTAFGTTPQPVQDGLLYIIPPSTSQGLGFQTFSTPTNLTGVWFLNLNLSVFTFSSVSIQPGELVRLSKAGSAWTVLDRIHAVTPGLTRIEEKTGDYIPVLADTSRVISINSPDPKTLTIPPGVFRSGASFEVVRAGTGTVTIQAGSGVVLQSLDNQNTIAGQNGVVRLLHMSGDTWLLSGDLA